jgi:hypothetical protein
MPIPAEIKRRHIHKRPTAVIEAHGAQLFLLRAIRQLELAEKDLAAAGWSGARVGIRQANIRLKSWSDKLRKELEAIVEGKF